MAERIEELKQKSRPLGLVLGVALAIFGGITLAAGFGLSRGAQEAHAIPITEPQVIFELCKAWLPSGLESEPIDFQFNVSDSSEVPPVTVTIQDVPEEIPGEEAACILLSVSTGRVEVTEVVPDGFVDPPVWFVGTIGEGGGIITGGESATAAFFIDELGCYGPDQLTVGTLRQAQVQEVQDGEPVCTLVFFNIQTEDPPPSVTVTVTATTTPPPAVCAICNRLTPPASTSTPVPPTNTPAASTPVPNTPIPPTATATTSVATQSPGLTDEQRTATAVAAARTAAAAATPIAPRTGDGAPAGTGQGTNLALILVALVMVGSGLTLVAAKGRR